MRLAQAARKLTITTDEIVSFFKKREIEIIKDSNTKLEEDHIELLFNYYGVPIKQEKPASSELEIDLVKEDQIVVAESKLEEEVIDKVEEKPNEVSDQTDSTIEASKESTTTNSIGETTSDKVDSEEDEIKMTSPQPIDEVKPSSKYKTVTDLLEEQEAKESSENADEESEEEEVVIKAPKVTLQGLNVVGKIDLPEPKPKEEKAEETSDKKETKRNTRKPYKKQNKKGRRKELTPQEIREREKRKAEQKRKAEEKAKKKQRETYYKENVLKPQQQLQKKKKPKKKQQVSATSSATTKQKPAPKTVLGKFWRWLNT